jgi:hypothetical protein
MLAVADSSLLIWMRSALGANPGRTVLLPPERRVPPLNPGILPHCKPRTRLIAILCVEQALGLAACCGPGAGLLRWRVAAASASSCDAVGGGRRAGTRTAARRPVMRGSRRLQWLAGLLARRRRSAGGSRSGSSGFSRRRRPVWRPQRRRSLVPCLH